MHRLDSHINDIEPRIEAICDNIPLQEEPSLQISLSAYGWILLDSWIAWRTLRFLLRETYIDNKVHDKWFQTPSSYKASQLMAIWDFKESSLIYIEGQTGKKIKYLIDSLVQEKRNASAHYSQKMDIQGTDSMEIKRIFLCLSKLFLFQETITFVKKINYLLQLKGYSDGTIQFGNSDRFDISDADEHILEYSQCNQIRVFFKDVIGEEVFVVFAKNGCFAGAGNDIEINKPVINEEQEKYDIWKNKGFYRDCVLFVETVEKCWRV